MSESGASEVARCRSTMRRAAVLSKRGGGEPDEQAGSRLRLRPPMGSRGRQQPACPRPARRGAEMSVPSSRANRLDRAIAELLAQAPEVEAAAVVSFDGLPMASALPVTMDEDRVAAMSAALLSLGERAAEGLGRGGLNQVYIEGEHGTVFLVSADDEAVLVAVAAKAAKVGMMLYEVRRAAAVVAEVLRAEDAVVAQEVAEVPAQPEAAPYETPSYTTPESYDLPRYDALDAPVAEAPAAAGTYAPVATDTTWPSYLPNGSGSTTAEPTPWS